MALQAHRQVEVVVGRIGVGGLRLAEKRNTVAALAADRNPFVIEHLGQRQHARHAVKGLFGLAIVAGKQQRQPAIESRLEDVGLAAAHLGEGRRGFLILLAVVVPRGPAPSRPARTPGFFLLTASFRWRSRSCWSGSVMPRMYCSNASRRIPAPAATKVSSETLKAGSICRVSLHASESSTPIRSLISPRALTGSTHPQVRHIHHLRLAPQCRSRRS